jgi:peptide-methionine (R)-S-oxide reductase
MAMELTEEEWQARLTPEQYETLRKRGTDIPFTGKLLNNKEKGDYTCAACGNVLFKSDHKFDSGSGWPSFYDLAGSDAVTLIDDTSAGMHRTEVECANCGGHLGHLFDDAYDQPGGKRYCINSTSLAFNKDQ